MVSTRPKRRGFSAWWFVPIGVAVLAMGMLPQIYGDYAASWWQILLLVTGPALIIVGIAGGLTGSGTKK